ncbi:hypothetical protein N7449_006798 [Penicillium cf. viridicatum]|uniref:Uncharacterized protein n=1 Tax=Penicillium cf. viridicatum TaxID=2972119 RepID=A0A9W9JG48_9EURO|nr:hypothetical protein N7449_006798 [Penicillium cf. viridicatum]
MGQQRARDTVSAALPRLLLGPNHTHSSALHKVRFVGPMREWEGFFDEVLSTIAAQKWSNKVVAYTLLARDLQEEKVPVGDENGLQGRFQQSMGQVVGAALGAQSINIGFGDFKAAGAAYDLVPDSAMLMNSSTGSLDLKAVGELKVPWVPEHRLSRGFVEQKMTRVLLGQPAEYMYDLKVKSRPGALNEDHVKIVDSGLVAWPHHLDAAKADMCPGEDEMLFQGHMFIQFCIMYLHFPRSDLVATIPGASKVIRQQQLLRQEYARGQSPGGLEADH